MRLLVDTHGGCEGWPNVLQLERFVSDLPEFLTRISDIVTKKETVELIRISRPRPFITRLILIASMRIPNALTEINTTAQ